MGIVINIHQQGGQGDCEHGVQVDDVVLADHAAS